MLTKRSDFLLISSLLCLKNYVSGQSMVEFTRKEWCASPRSFVSFTEKSLLICSARCFAIATCPIFGFSSDNSKCMIVESAALVNKLWKEEADSEHDVKCSFYYIIQSRLDGANAEDLVAFYDFRRSFKNRVEDADWKDTVSTGVSLSPSGAIFNAPNTYLEMNVSSTALESTFDPGKAYTLYIRIKKFTNQMGTVIYYGDLNVTEPGEPAIQLFLNLDRLKFIYRLTTSGGAKKERQKGPEYIPKNTTHYSSGLAFDGNLNVTIYNKGEVFNSMTGGKTLGTATRIMKGGFYLGINPIETNRGYLGEFVCFGVAKGILSLNAFKELDRYCAD